MCVLGMGVGWGGGRVFGWPCLFAVCELLRQEAALGGGAKAAGLQGQLFPMMTSCWAHLSLLVFA
jgi:hypothetical protein